MPLWLLIISVVLLTILFCIFIRLLLFVFIGYTVRDNIVFDNKYKRKIYQLKEKLKKYNDKINDRINYLNYKSIYCENIKILHEKNLDTAILISSCEDFMKYEKNRKKNKEK